jgi:hypothetical protein
MQELVKERIRKLRQEIAEISEASRLYLQGSKRMPLGADQERRPQRLQEILEELSTLREWEGREFLPIESKLPPKSSRFP